MEKIFEKKKAKDSHFNNATIVNDDYLVLYKDKEHFYVVNLLQIPNSLIEPLYVQYPHRPNMISGVEGKNLMISGGDDYLYAYQISQGKMLQLAFSLEYNGFSNCKNQFYSENELVISAYQKTITTINLKTAEIFLREIKNADLKSKYHKVSPMSNNIILDSEVEKDIYKIYIFSKGNN